MIDELNKLVKNQVITVNDISEKYKVNNRTVKRWLKQETKPKLEIQYELDMLTKNGQLESIKMDIKEEEEVLRVQVDNLLRGLRESFHRWGKYSTRNEALEDLAKLILAQISLVKFGEKALHEYDNIGSDESINKELIDSIDKALFKILDDIINLQSSNWSFKISLKNDQGRLLKEIIDEFKKINWNSLSSITRLDLFNEIFGRFLSNTFVDEKEMGQYLTPIEMTRFMVALVINNLSDDELSQITDPIHCKDFGYILDPSCGAGSFFTEFVHQLMPKVAVWHGYESLSKWLNNLGKYVFFGIDKSDRMLRFTIFNLSSLGIPCNNIYSMNSLDKKINKEVLCKKLEGNAKIILTNPPFGAEFRGNMLLNYKLYKNWASKSPKKIDSELLFLERYVDWLCDDGYCATVVPDSVLTNKGLYSDLRKGISSKISLDTVVSFPQETFSAAGTSTKTSVMFFQKSSLMSETYFGICSDVGFKVITKGSNRVKVQTNQSDLDQLLNEATDEVKKKVIGRKFLFDDNSSRWDASFHASLNEKEFNIINNKSSQYLRVKDVARLINDRINPQRIYEKFRYIEISNILSSGIVKSKQINAVDTPSRARKQVRVNDVLASTVRPEQKNIGYVFDQNDDQAICTTGLAVLRPNGIESSVLVELLKSDFITRQLSRNTLGIAYPSVDESCFLDLVLPIKKGNLEALNNDAVELRKLRQKLHLKDTQFKSDIDNSIKIWEKGNFEY